MLSACKEALSCFFKDASLRVLVLSWDREDKRHKIQGRDDQANFHRMLYHGLRRNADWHREPRWRWFHDEMTNLDQDEIRAFLNGTSEDKGYQKHPKLFQLDRELLDFREVRQVSSRQTPLIGIADLFAGVVRESRLSGSEMHKAYEKAQTVDQSALDLFIEDDDEPSQPLGMRARAELGAHLYHLGRRGKHGISLRTAQRFETPNPRGRFCFWHYEPQSELDQAPRHISDSRKRKHQAEGGEGT